jgi:hypothetical protein
MNGWIDGWREGQIDLRRDVCMYGWMNGSTV